MRWPASGNEAKKRAELVNTLEWLLFLAPVVATAGFAHVIAGRSRRNCLSLRLEGVRINRITKQLLLDMQQHRGMVNAFLSGDQSFAAKLERKKTEIERDMGALDALHSRLLAECKCWGGIRDAWQSLRGESQALATEDSFRRHSELIRAIIYLMGDVAERSQIVGACPTDAALASALWHKLPIAAEGLGQARALGSGVAAKGHCSSVVRIRLRFLEGRIRETMKWVNDDLARAEPAQAAAMITLWDAAHKTVADFLALLEKEIINTEKPAVDAGHYFSTATKTLDALFSAYDQISDSMEKKLACRVNPS